MAHSSFPQGFSQGVVIKGVPLSEIHPGQVFWVNNSTVLADKAIGGSDTNDGTYRRPFNTIDYAVGKCVANRGDVVLVMPAHAETVDAAAFIDLDVAGISIIGLGKGENRPKLSYTAAAGSVVFGADDVHLDNFIFEATIDSVVLAIDVENGADDGRISNCHFKTETLGTDEFDDAIILAATVDNFEIDNNKFDSDDNTQVQSAINVAGAALGCHIHHNIIQGKYAVANIEMSATVEEVLIHDNVLINGAQAGLNTLAVISVGSGGTGYIHDNMCYTNVASALTGAIVADSCFLGENRIATTAETAPLLAEAVSDGILRSVATTGIVDTNGTTIATVTGTVDVWAVILRQTTAADSEVNIGIATDCTDETLNTTLGTVLDWHETSSAEGDTLSTTAPGAVMVATEVPGDVTPIWTAPARVTAGLIEVLTTGTPGALVMDATIIYAPVSADGSIA